MISACDPTELGFLVKTVDGATTPRGPGVRASGGDDAMRSFVPALHIGLVPSRWYSDSAYLRVQYRVPPLGHLGASPLAKDDGDDRVCGEALPLGLSSFTPEVNWRLGVAWAFSWLMLLAAFFWCLVQIYVSSDHHTELRASSLTRGEWEDKVRMPARMPSPLLTRRSLWSRSPVLCLSHMPLHTQRA